MSADFRVAAISLAVLALTGCATEARLTVHSQPEGAYITTVHSGQGLGMAPAVIHYDANYLLRHRDANGCYVLDGVEARWPSGAASSIEPVVVCNNYSENYDITLSRPAEYPDLDKDYAIALQVRETRAHEREAEAAMATAAAIQRDAIASEQLSWELARQRAEQERIRREELDRRERERHEHDGRYDRRDGDHRDGNRDGDKDNHAGPRTGMNPPAQNTMPPPATALTPTIHRPVDAPQSAPALTPTIHAPAATPPPAAAPPAKPAEPKPYDPNDPHRPKGSKGWKGDE